MKDIITSIILFLTFLLLIFVLSIYCSYLAGIAVGIIPTVVIPLAKKYLTFGNLDEYIKKTLNRNNSKIILSTILFLTSVCIVFFNSSNENIDLMEKEFAGMVWNENDEPLSNVIVVLPELNLKDTTDDLGMFRFVINNFGQTTVSLIATKEGFETYEAEGSVGNKSYTFKMYKK